MNELFIHSGLPRTGTVGMFVMADSLGINAEHEPLMISRENYRKNLNVQNPPGEILSQVRKLKRHIDSQPKPLVSANWAYSPVLNEIYKIYPNAHYTFTFRDLIDQANSAYWYIFDYNNGHPAYSPHDANAEGEIWVKIQSHFLQNIKQMKVKPKMMLFDKLREKHYRDYLLEIWGKKDDLLAVEKMNEYYKVKWNSSNRKKWMPINDSILEKGEQLKKEIFSLCEEV